MSIHARGSGYDVRWRAGGKQRSRAFMRLDDARKFEAKVKRQKQLGRGAATLFHIRKHDMREQIYVIQGSGHVKIGLSVNPAARLVGLQSSSPLPLKLVWRIACPNAKAFEKALHERYREHRVSGEWFLAKPVLADLAGLAKLGAHQFETPENRVHQVCVDSRVGRGAS